MCTHIIGIINNNIYHTIVVVTFENVHQHFKPVQGNKHVLIRLLGESLFFQFRQRGQSQYWGSILKKKQYLWTLENLIGSETILNDYCFCFSPSTDPFKIPICILYS